MSKRIFMSWSGKRAKHVAEALRDWLAYVLPDGEPFVSGQDIRAGQFWDNAIRDRVKTSAFCVVC